MVRLLICLLSVLAATTVHGADIASLVNTIRMQGCGGQPGVEAAVQPSGPLDRAARQLARGGRLSTALERGRYLAASSTSVHIDGTTEIATLRQVLHDEYCATVNNPAFSEIGVYRRGDETWLILADPFSPPDPADQHAVARQALELVNAARRQARKCGRSRHEATHPLVLSATLSQVALEHARDLARRGVLGHRGTDGSEPAERVTRAGYRWRATAENVAAGQPDAAAAVAHWLDSPGHCANLMGTQFTEMGLAFAIEPQSGTRVYWAQVFAAPRP